MRSTYKTTVFNIRSILLIAFVLRVVWALLVPIDLISDSYLYDAFARSIATGKGYAFPSGDITVYWPVGAPAIYALVYKLFGLSFLPIVIFNVLIGTSIVWLTYAIANRYLNEINALIAASLVAIWPILIQFTTIMSSELIFIFFLLSAIHIWGSKNIKPIFRAVLWGALICAATYVRPTALLVLILLPILEFLANGKLRDCIISLCVATITASILFSPWVYRNHQVFDEFVLVSANGGANLWMGNNPNSNGGYTDLPDLNFKNEVMRDQYFKKQAVDFIIHNPISYAKLAVLRTITTYKAETIGIVWNGTLEKNYSKTSLLIMKLISSLYWWAIVGLAVLGIYGILKDRKLKIFNVLFVICGFFFLFPILTVAQDRYHMPINPFLAIFAAYAIQSFYTKQKIKAQHITAKFS